MMQGPVPNRNNVVSFERIGTCSRSVPVHLRLSLGAWLELALELRLHLQRMRRPSWPRRPGWPRQRPQLVAPGH